MFLMHQCHECNRLNVSIHSAVPVGLQYTQTYTHAKRDQAIKSATSGLHLFLPHAHTRTLRRAVCRRIREDVIL